jgi:hypothetical protein
MNELERMTHQELRRYVLANRNDRRAIELLARQTMASPRLKSFGADETDRLGEILKGGYTN